MSFRCFHPYRSCSIYIADLALHSTVSIARNQHWPYWPALEIFLHTRAQHSTPFANVDHGLIQHGHCISKVQLQPKWDDHQRLGGHSGQVNVLPGHPTAAMHLKLSSEVSPCRASCDLHFGPEGQSTCPGGRLCRVQVSVHIASVVSDPGSQQVLI